MAGESKVILRNVDGLALTMMAARAAEYFKSRCLSFRAGMRYGTILTYTVDNKERAFLVWRTQTGTVVVRAEIPPGEKTAAFEPEWFQQSAVNNPDLSCSNCGKDDAPVWGCREITGARVYCRRCLQKYGYPRPEGAV